MYMILINILEVHLGESFFSLLLDRIKELKKLNHSIFINFLELLDILIKSPSSSKVNYLDQTQRK